MSTQLKRNLTKLFVKTASIKKRAAGEAAAAKAAEKVAPGFFAKMKTGLGNAWTSTKGFGKQYYADIKGGPLASAKKIISAIEKENPYARRVTQANRIFKDATKGLKSAKNPEEIAFYTELLNAAKKELPVARKGSRKIKAEKALAVLGNPYAQGAGLLGVGATGLGGYGAYSLYENSRKKSLLEKLSMLFS